MRSVEVGPDGARMRWVDSVAMHRSSVSLAGQRDRWSERLPGALTIPRTYVVGGRTTLSFDLAELTEAGVTVTVVPGGGHNMMVDNPEAFVEALTR